MHVAQNPDNVDLAFELLSILIMRYRLNRSDEVLVGVIYQIIF